MDHISETLEALSDPQTAKRAGQHTRSLRGIRGVPNGEIARVAAAAWQDDPPSVPEDSDDLTALFGAAWEDGLVAIGLLAACAPDAPGAALELALDWAGRVDDVATADALGQLVLAPAVLLTDRQSEVLAELAQHHRPEVRRIVAAMGLGFTTSAVQGPAGAPLRERVGSTRLQMVDKAFSRRLGPVCDALAHDDAPPVRKAMRRLLRAWTDDDPQAVVAWAESQLGGLHKMLGSEVKRARRQAGA
jgi:hypothetical protein